MRSCLAEHAFERGPEQSVGDRDALNATQRVYEQVAIRGPGALGLVNPFVCAARAVLRGALRGFAALLLARVARLCRGAGDAASPLASQRPT